MKVLLGGVFGRTVKKLQKNERLALDDAVKLIISNPEIGNAKKGNLVGVRVYKYKINETQYLLGYRYDKQAIVLTLLALGTNKTFIEI